MNTIPIRAQSARYDALVGFGLLERLGTSLAGLVRGSHCAVIADENTAQFFGEKVLESLRAADFQPALVRIPPGENSKSLEQLRTVCEQMAAAGLDRSSFVVALGGGVVGDLAGFAAAIYHRGIPYVQVPTTLLAQVDSSIGGKTGVNTPAGKNLLGAVHQPVLVLADVATLATLPARELRQGFAEIIKHGIIAEPAMFDAVQLFKLHAVGTPSWKRALQDLIARNVEIKARIVAHDERDVTGARAVLNFGHTVGHAIEKAAGYRDLLHGEAVSLGMVAACEVSVRKAGLPEADRQRVLEMLRAVELPTVLPNGFPREAILAALPSDKKFERGQVRFVVTPGLGSAHLATDVTIEDVRNALAQL